MRQHYVIFFSPGTFVAEQTQKPVDSWDIEKAQKMARDIKERHGATPYGFCFITRARTNADLDSREVRRSKMYYLGGEVLTLRQIKARKDPQEKILISNMECNRWNRVVVNSNSYKWTQPLRRGDVVLNFSMRGRSE